MIAQRKSVVTGLALVLAASLAACAPQQQSTPAPAATAPQASIGSQAMPGHNMSGMQGHNMAGHNMAGMDHQAMIAHCAQMRRQRSQGTRLSPDMQQMMAQCDQMGRSMGSPRR